MTNDEVNSLANKVFDANIQGNIGTTRARTTQLNVEINRERAEVGLKVESAVPTTLGHVIGIQEFRFVTEASASYQGGDLEVAIQLDVTTSMRGDKLPALKEATKRLIDILIPDQDTGQNSVRVALAPFSGGVNVGRYATAVTGRSSSCVYERHDLRYQDTDLPPFGSKRLLTSSDLGHRKCPSSATIMPLTDDKYALKSSVESLKHAGTTAGHLGTAWVWYLLSPEWSGIWPSASEPVRYHDGQTTKVAVLMTDGEYNTFGGKLGRSERSKSVDAAKRTCDAMKNKGIIIYTVGFKLTTYRARDIMAYCASGNNRSFSADSNADLLMAFSAIAVGITQLRLTH
ncbi:MAG: hypothetical protein AAF732_15050 [Pseudomonadota bacterium]